MSDESETSQGGLAIPKLVLVVCTLLAVGAVVWLTTKSTHELRDLLRWLSPRAIELTFLLMVGSFAVTFAEIRGSLAGGRFAPALGLGLVAFAAVSWLPPATHRIYYDEDIYQNVAQNIVWTGRAQMCNEGEIAAGGYRCAAHEYNKEPNGFPFLLSLGFRIGGVSETVSHRVNHLVFAFGAMAVYWVGCLLFRDGSSAVAAALIYTFVPQSLLWAATVAVEPSAAAFAAFGLGAWLLFLRSPSPSLSSGLVAASSLAFASQLRPESGLVLVAAAFFVLILAPHRLARKEVWLVALLVGTLLVPHFAHLASVRGESWGSAGEKFSGAVVEGNLKTNAAYHVSGEDFPVLYTLLALLGLAVPRGRWREAWGALAWFALFFGIFIPFYAGSYRYGADVRFALVSAAPLALLAGRGSATLAEIASRWLPSSSSSARLFVRALPVALILYAFSAFLPLVRAVGPEAELARADHDVARRMIESLPEDSILLTHNPGMALVMGQSAVQASVATYQPATMESYFRRYSGGVYFHFNFWCNVDDPTQNEFCTNILSEYGTQVLMDESAGFYRYILYRLLPKVRKPAN